MYNQRPSLYAEGLFPTESKRLEALVVRNEGGKAAVDVHIPYDLGPATCQAKGKWIRLTGDSGIIYQDIQDSGESEIVIPILPSNSSLKLYFSFDASVNGDDSCLLESVDYPRLNGYLYGKDSTARINLKPAPYYFPPSVTAPSPIEIDSEGRITFTVQNDLIIFSRTVSKILVPGEEFLL